MRHVMNNKEIDLWVRSIEILHGWVPNRLCYKLGRLKCFIVGTQSSLLFLDCAFFKILDPTITATRSLNH